MRDIVSPLDGFRSPFGQRFRDAYAVLGARPALVFDFANEYYRTGGSQTTFDSAMTHSRTSNATMVDSDGLLKWAPHNLALNSATPATQSITVISGADYTVECTGVSIALSGAGSGTVTEGNPVTITASTTTLTLTVTGSTGTMWAYRSDLGGMVDNPDRGDSYVPTTSSARYLPRRGHHVYNGASWVNEGMLHESESRVNLVTYSNDFTDASWSKTNTATLAVDAIGPDGETSAVTLVDSGATGSGSVLIDSANITVATSTNYTVSVFAKADQLSWMRLGARNFTSTAEAWFNLSTGEVGTTAGAELVTQGVEDFGNGWYRCYVVFTSDAADTVGNVRIVVGDGDNDATVDLDGTSSILIYGAQLEAGSTPSSYIPTSGATATRAADTLTVPSANLPWPTVNVIGPELVTNGTFDTDTSGWASNGGSASVSSGQAAFTRAGSVGGEGFHQDLTLSTSSVYKVTFDIVSISSGLGVLNFGGVVDATLSAGSYELYIVPSASTTIIGFWCADGETITIDNVSVREIDPLAVSIQMDGRMTYADDGTAVTAALGSGAVSFVYYAVDDNNGIDISLDTQSGETGEINFRQRVGGVTDVIRSSTTAYSPGINQAFNIASYHGSTFINGAVDGAALTADTTPTALPDLSTTDLNLAYDYMGTVGQFRLWAADLGDAGIAEAST